MGLGSARARLSYLTILSTSCNDLQQGCISEVLTEGFLTKVKYLKGKNLFISAVEMGPAINYKHGLERLLAYFLDPESALKCFSNRRIHVQQYNNLMMGFTKDRLPWKGNLHNKAIPPEIHTRSLGIACLSLCDSYVPLLTYMSSEKIVNEQQ